MSSTPIRTVTIGNVDSTTTHNVGEEVTTFITNKFWQGGSETAGKLDAQVGPEAEDWSQPAESP